MANVTLRGSYIVKPSKPTWEGVFPISEWDQVDTITHFPTISFYKHSQDWVKSSKSMLDTLKESLGRILVHFYPLAGRVRWLDGGRLELICNAMGGMLIEAESSSQLSDFEDFASQTHRFKDLIPFVDYDKPIEGLPLVLAQLTRFRCGGVSVAIVVSHIVVDGQSAFHFIDEWARLARGEPLKEAPFHNRTILQNRGSTRNEAVTTSHGEEDTDSNCLPLLIGHETDLEERKKPTAVCILPVSKEQLRCLKNAVNIELQGENVHPYTRFEVITAHVWRTACKARGHVNEQPTCVCFPIDVRRRVHPPLPPKYFGNAILDGQARAKAKEIMTSPLGEICCKIREGIEKVKDEYVWANLEFLRTLPDFTKYQDLNGLKSGEGPFYGNPNIVVVSWLNFPIYGLDFGWGKEVYMGPATHDSDGGCLILPGPENDGSIKIALCLQVAHIDSFKKFFDEDII